MRSPQDRTRVVLALAAALTLAAAARADWFKGNTHTHSLNSDGRSTPDEVARWYRGHGYDFLFITDHDFLTRVEPLNALLGADGRFLLIPGEEVTSNVVPPPVFVHVNALNPRRVVEHQAGPSALATLQKDIDATLAAGGVAQINHPNFLWQLTADDIAASRGARLMEIMNMHPSVNNAGAGPSAPSCEEMWDQVLSRGKVIWGVASDDAHQLRDADPETTGSTDHAATPGHGWIVVRAARLGTDEIMGSIARGDFYASTGVALLDYIGDAKQVKVSVHPRGNYQPRYRIQFIGRNGRILEDTVATAAAYVPHGDEGYVRVRITDSNGNQAWTQPVFLDGRKAD